MLNMPLPAKSDGKAFRHVFETVFKPALTAFKPELIFISAGFDAHANDPLADLALTKADYVWVTKFIKGIAKKHDSQSHHLFIRRRISFTIVS